MFKLRNHLLVGMTAFFLGCLLAPAQSHASQLAIKTTSLPSGATGVWYDTGLVITGGTAPYTITATGLPSGLSITNQWQAIIGLTTSGGTYSVGLTVTDSSSTKQTATATFSLVISGAGTGTSALTIATTSLPGATTGSAYSTTVAASGGTKPYAYTASGLPGGLSINSSSGAISGTPTSSGTASVAITVKDSTTPTAKTASTTLSLVVSAVSSSPLTITTTSLPAATAGSAYSTSVAASGGTAPYTYSASGLPGGLSISSSTGSISGTPTASGTDSVAVTVKDSTTPTAKTASATLGLSVSGATQAASCGNMSTGNGASLNGFVPFPSSNLWNTNIASAALDANSATIISGLGSSALHPDFSSVADGSYGIPYVVVDSSVTPGVNVAMDGYADQSDITLYPIPPTAPIEGLPANCSVSGDQHVLVLDRNKCWLYETWSTELCNGSWSASNGAIWDLSNTEHRPYGWTSADAAGLPVFPGLVRYDEVAAGAINHALRVTVNNTLSGSGGGYFVNPATHAAGNSSSTHNVMGMRLRLKSSFNISGFSASNQVILKAMQQYGLIVADNGSNLFFQGAPDARWNDDDLDNLKTIGASNFEVVQMSPSYPGYEESTAPTGSAPSISSFTASETTVAPGTTVTLNWTVSGDSYDYIDVVGPVRNGSQTVAPTKTTTYTLNSTNAYGRSTKEVTVTVN